MITEPDKRPQRRIISEQTSHDMRRLLRDVVIYGSGKNANIEGYEVAGKTGTANKIVDGRYIKGKNVTSFVSAFPSSNPKYALMVIIDDPKPIKETYGFVTSGWNACPTGGNIISRIAPQLNIRPNFDISVQKEKVLENYTKKD